jgi:hypothetical protein
MLDRSKSRCQTKRAALAFQVGVVLKVDNLPCKKGSITHQLQNRISFDNNSLSKYSTLVAGTDSNMT